MVDQQAQRSSWVGRSNPGDIVRRGQEAWARLRVGRSWDDWITVGEAIQVGRHHAMIEARTNEARGSRYESIFGGWLRTTGFDTLDKADRKRLLDCLGHRAQIEAWRQTLPTNKLLELNHPTSVWRKWRNATVAGNVATSQQVPRLSPVAKLKQEMMRLEEENFRFRRAGDDLFSGRDTAADIARLIADRLQQLSPTKVQQVLDHLRQVVSDRAALPREPMTPEPPKRNKKRRRTIEDFQGDVIAKRTAEAAS
jgi:hypothetical protein